MLNCAHYHVDGGIAVAENFFFKRDDFLALASIFFRNLVRSSISSHSISPWPGRALAGPCLRSFSGEAGAWEVPDAKFTDKHVQ